MDKDKNEDKDEADHLSGGWALKSALSPQAAKYALLRLLSHLIVIIIIMKIGHVKHDKVAHESVTIVRTSLILGKPHLSLFDMAGYVACKALKLKQGLTLI